MELYKKYDAIFCYDILQLFLKHERKIIIENCIKYCKDNGMILFSCLSKEDILFGNGTEIEENTFEVNNGLYIHFSNEFEMKNLNRNLEMIKLEHFKQNDTVDITKERSRIYGIYKK
jgi:hypothetical protein